MFCTEQVLHVFAMRFLHYALGAALILDYFIDYGGESRDKCVPKDCNYYYVFTLVILLEAFRE